jgi:UMF1 family MFS transporter
MIGVEFATIFTNAMLPALGDRATIGRISGSGYAIGYAGGVLSLFIMLLFFAETEAGTTLAGLAPPLGLDPEAREGTRFVGPFTALWYILFMIPFFVTLRDERTAAVPGGVGRALRDVLAMLQGLLSRRSLAAYLGASMLYRDALVALYGFGGVYATLVLDWSVTQVGVFGILGAVSAALATWAGGRIDSRLGPKPVIVATVLILSAVCVVIVAMSREMLFGVPLPPGSAVPDIVFYVVGATIGAAGGVLQAASRTMMVRHANPERPTEAFGLYALSGKATAFLAPALIGAVTYVSESARLGISPLIALFLLSLVLLRWVEPEGERAAP